MAKLTLNGVTPSMWGDYFYGEAVPNNGTVFLLAEDHVKNQTLIGVNVTTGLSDFVSYSYDENGNLVERLSSEGPVLYEWDHRNRLTKVIHPDGSETAYEYCPACPLGKLSKMTSTDGSTVEWVWDGISFLREVDSQDALPMEYFAGVSVKREGAWYYLHMDVMGTVWQVTDENGQVVNDFQWDAWGNELTGTFTDGSSVCQIGWQGKRFDKSQGVFYSVARWYDQRLGRFTQVDPLTKPGGGPDVMRTPSCRPTVNSQIAWLGKYETSLNDPIDYSDPTGFVPEIVMPPWASRCPGMAEAVDMANRALSSGQNCRKFWKCKCKDRSPRMHLHLKTYHPVCLAFDMWTYPFTPNTIGVCEKRVCGNYNAAGMASLLLHEIGHHCQRPFSLESVANAAQDACSEEIW